MNKLALATAAAVAGVALTATASAEISLNGSFSQDIGFGSWRSGSAEKSEGNVHLQSDSEIHFKASGTTDGGVGVAVKIEMEAQPSAGSSIDETQISFTGGFGKVTLGSEDSASISHGYVGIGGGYAGMGYYDGGNNYTPAGTPFPAGYNDSQKVVYSFPAMGGLSVGVSFAPDTNGADADTTNSNNNGEVSVGASYSANLGTATVSIGGGMVSSTDSDLGCSVKGASGAGISVGFGDTTISLRSDRHSEEDSRGFGFGIDHSLGALGIGLGYGVGTDTHEDSDNVLVAGVSYSLGGGVSISAAVARGTQENLGGTPEIPAVPARTAAAVDDPCTPFDDTNPPAAADATPAVPGNDESSVGLGLRLGFSF